jgi:hypothetical protein
LWQIKKDYLNEGAMADTADLVVLGGWYGTGQKVSNANVTPEPCIQFIYLPPPPHPPTYCFFTINEEIILLFE